MKANELRIGNYVDTAVGIIRIEEIPLKSNPLYNPNALHPIPIDEQWLFKFGFNKIIGVTHSSGTKVEFNVWQKGEFTYNTIQDAWWFNGVLDNPPKHIHQLQNLYFALTGSELTIK